MYNLHDEERRKTMALTAMAQNFDKEFSAPLLSLWLDILVSHPAHHVEEAVRRVIEGYEFKTLPPFAVLKRHLDDLNGTSEKALELQSSAEWMALLESISKYGRYQKPTLHRTTQHVIRAMGGWSTVCSWLEAELNFKHREFLRLWKESHGREEVLALGADAVAASLTSGRDRDTGPQRIGGGFYSALPEGEPSQ